MPGSSGLQTKKLSVTHVILRPGTSPSFWASKVQEFSLTWSFQTERICLKDLCPAQEASPMKGVYQ
jgi:hypothetical protein